MQFLPYILTAIITSLGLVIGAILTIIAKEEIKSLKPYFTSAIQILPALMIVAYMTTYYVYWYWLLLIAAILFLFLKRYFNLNHGLLAYFILGFLFYMSHFFPKNLILNSSLIFLFGLPAGSLIFNPKKKDYKTILLPIILFLAVAIIFYFLNIYFFGFYELTS